MNYGDSGNKGKHGTGTTSLYHYHTARQALELLSSHKNQINLGTKCKHLKPHQKTVCKIYSLKGIAVSTQIKVEESLTVFKYFFYLLDILQEGSYKSKMTSR